ncbi:MAG: galactosyldiacylglycerol synthase [Bacillus sp. (in: firmicutes)]
MKKLLFLPLMYMQSGHHQVADALIDMIQSRTQNILFDKIDLLSYTNESFSKMVSYSYLKWIHLSPKSYHLAYNHLFYEPSTQEHAFHWYPHIFMNKLEQLLKEVKPNLIFCTHGFPSHLMSKLKMEGRCDIPIINVYTDFFVNSVWAFDGIDLHFLPNQEVKDHFMDVYNVDEQKLIVTGIPVHEKITPAVDYKKKSNRLKVIVAGGNSGLGESQKLFRSLAQSRTVDFYILCGNNHKLYKDILQLKAKHIIPLSYISSRSEMNKLYEEVDAIITKPGGVTISEALQKKLPIFVHSVLPGQEEINLEYLVDKDLVFLLDDQICVEKQLLSVLEDEYKMNRWKNAVHSYKGEMEIQNSDELVELILTMLDMGLEIESQVDEM